MGVMQYGLDFGNIWDRYQKVDMPWPRKNNKRSSGTGNGVVTLSNTVTVVQVQPTVYGYVGRYNTNMTHLHSNMTHYATLGESDWDCHDLLQSAFELDNIPAVWGDGDDPKINQTTDNLPPSLFVRIYADTTTAECGGGNQAEIAIALSATTVFDECDEYSPWACERPNYVNVSYALVALVGLIIVWQTHQTFKKKVPKTWEEDD